jgi:RNA polymerase sigma-70 factor (ECF subfamily)
VGVGGGRVEARWWGLAVEPGRQHLSNVVASHVEQVVASARMVPACDAGIVDELTRLALEAGRGDELALAGFVRRSQADVWRLAAHLVDRASADDLTQEVYVRAIPALARFRGDAPARIWLLSIARRTCADEIRRRTRRRRRLGVVRSIEDELVEPSTAGDETEAVDLSLLVDGLGDDRRAAFTLTQVLGLSYDEAASVCGVPVGTIRSRVARARADLLDAVETFSDERRSGGG